MNVVEQLVKSALNNFEAGITGGGRDLTPEMRLMMELMILRGFCGCFEYMTQGLAALPDDQAERAMAQLADDLYAYVDEHARRARL